MNKRATSIVVLICFFVSGCGMAGVVAMGAASGGLLAFEVDDAMKGVDLRTTIQAGFKRVWKEALATAQEMQIQILEKKLDQEKDGGIITGKSNTHEKLQIVVETVTPSITSVGIKARKRELMGLPVTRRDVDHTFAGIIANTIERKCQTKKATGVTDPKPVCDTGPREPEETITPSVPSAEKPPVIYLMTMKNSNVRAAPTIKSQIITTIKKGTKIEKISESADWFEVRLSSGETGHIYKTLVVEVP